MLLIGRLYNNASFMIWNAQVPLTIREKINLPWICNLTFPRVKGNVCDERCTCLEIPCQASTIYFLITRRLWSSLRITIPILKI